MADIPQPAGPPDLELLEYVLLSAPDLTGLGTVADAVVELVHARAIRVMDAVVLVRPADRATVHASRPGEHPSVAVVGPVVDGSVLLSAHDVELAGLVLGPGETALLLVVEDRWAGSLSDAATAGGARVTAGERIARDRVLASLGPRRGDLLVRGPAGSGRDDTSAVDRAAQVRTLADLVERGLLSLEQYDVQRRRVISGD